MDEGRMGKATRRKERTMRQWQKKGKEMEIEKRKRRQEEEKRGGEKERLEQEEKLKEVKRKEMCKRSRERVVKKAGRVKTLER